MPRKIGRRAAQPARSTDITFGGDSFKRPIILPDGEYDLTVKSAGFVTSKKGAISFLPVLENADEARIRVQPMLVASPGGDSDLTFTNKAIIQDMAGIAEGTEVAADDLLKQLEGSTVSVELHATTDLDGMAINRITDGWLAEE